MTAKLAMKTPELSCFIGNLFATLDPPCHGVSKDEVIICGLTLRGNRAEIRIAGDIVHYEGDPEDLQCSRYGRCPNEDACGMKKLRGEWSG